MTANLLFQHYVDKARRLPWRSPPGGPPADPYRVWLSEVMLQQTTVATVTPRFERFVARWPTVEALAAAEEAEVLKEWAGLGYYARARNLIACAREVVRIGGFPDGEEALRRLPGIGAYTAAAIAAIAFGRRAVVVDTNVERIIARLHGIERPVAEARADILRFADAMTPATGAGDHAQAMMDLGATICRPRNPDCPSCPLQGHCAANRSGDPARFPGAKAKKARPVRQGLAYWTEEDGRLWLVRRPAKGLLGGMAALPGDDWTGSGDGAPIAIARVTHVFTHFELRLAVVGAEQPVGDGWWQEMDRLDDAGLPTLYARAVAEVVRRRAAA